MTSVYAAITEVAVLIAHIWHAAEKIGKFIEEWGRRRHQRTKWIDRPPGPGQDKAHVEWMYSGEWIYGPDRKFILERRGGLTLSEFIGRVPS
jgi:hypothetical protein